MEFRDQDQDATYQSTTYKDDRTKMRSFIIDIDDASTTTFSKTIGEPLVIDKLSDVYLDSFITFFCLANTASAAMGFLLDIDQFNIQTASTQNENISDKIYIPNDAPATNKTIVHKGKKFNYVCSLNPTRLYEITGSITNCPVSGTSPATNFSGGGTHPRFIAEFMIVDRDSDTEEAPMKMYQAPGYLFERHTRKSLVIDITIGSTVTSFSVTLQEPFIIDALSDIYLDSFTTFNALQNDTGTNSSVMGFLLDIDQFNIDTRSTNLNMSHKIMIPNEATTDAGTVIHKGRKMNYICPINPTTLSTISGLIARCPFSEWTGSPDSHSVAFASGGRFIAEFLIIAR